MSNLGAGLKTQHWDPSTLPKFEKSFCMPFTITLSKIDVYIWQTRKCHLWQVVPPRRSKLSEPRNRCVYRGPTCLSPF